MLRAILFRHFDLLAQNLLIPPFFLGQSEQVEQAVRLSFLGAHRLVFTGEVEGFDFAFVGFAQTIYFFAGDEVVARNGACDGAKAVERY